MALDNPQTAKERLQVARITLACRSTYGGDFVPRECLSAAIMPSDYVSMEHVDHLHDRRLDDHEARASGLLDGLSVHEVTMAEIELDEEASE